jgi:hypothetical protein
MRRARCRILLALGFVLLARPVASPAPGQTTAPSVPLPIIDVERADPTVQRITIDPAHPPPKMPRMHPGEAALTQYYFDCAVHVNYEIVRSDRLPDGRIEVTAQIRAARVKLTLDDRIYMPTNANLPLRAHEEGHREVNERVFAADAEPAARALAERILAKEFTGAGADEDAAGKAATDLAVNELGNVYLSVVAGRASRIGDEYDRITLHGTRPINVARAVQTAFEQDEKSHPATMPATMP